MAYPTAHNEGDDFRQTPKEGDRPKAILFQKIPGAPDCLGGTAHKKVRKSPQQK